MDPATKGSPSALWLNYLPSLATLRHYRREWLAGDVVAGVSVCLVMIPEVVAYAGMMGLAPQHGLYAAMVPLVVYALFGRTCLVIVGLDIALHLFMASTNSHLGAV